MTSRRDLLAGAATIGVTSPAFCLATEPKPFVEGKDFILVDPPVEYPARPILVHDFFAYTCPHCYRLAPFMHEYAESIATDPNVRLIPVPVAWEENFELFPKIYYAFEELGRLQELHMTFWEWMLQGEHPWNTVQEAQVDIEKWAGEHGIDAPRWNATLDSFIVRNKVRQATQIWQQYNIDSTPVIGIAGRFITAPHMTGSRPRAIEAVRMLVDRVKAEGV